jgi:hypothetical protein
VHEHVYLFDVFTIKKVNNYVFICYLESISLTSVYFGLYSCAEELPEVSVGEIEIALGQLKNGKAPGEDGVTTELLKAGGKPVLRELQKLFNAVLFEGRTPEAWNRSVVVLFFKKGDKSLLKNYRPISLLSHVYKLFSRVITNRLAR